MNTQKILICFLLITSLFIARETKAQDTANFKTNESSLCFNDSTEFINTSTENCGIPISYFWNFGDTTTGAVDTSSLKKPKYKYENIGLYQATLIVNWACAPPDTMTRNVNISIIPPPNIIFSFFISGSIVCTNDPVTYRAIVDSTILWYFDWGDGSSIDTISDNPQVGTSSHAYSTTGFYTLEVIAENKCGKDTVYSSLIEVLAPAPGPTALFAPDTVCDTEIFDTYTTSSLPSGYSTFWRITGGGYQTSATGTFSDTFINIQAIKNVDSMIVQLFFGKGGVAGIGTITCSSDTITKKIIIKPSPANKEIIGSATVCAGSISSYWLEANSGSSFKWDCAGGTIFGSDSTSQVNISWGGSGNGTLQVIETNTFGCTGDTNFKSVTIINCTATASKASLNSINTSIESCTGLLIISNIGDTIQFIDESTNEPLEWFWEFPGGLPTTSNLQYPKIAYNAPGTYDVRLRVRNQYGYSKQVTYKNYVQVISSADNLVPNPGFESYSNCPDNWSAFNGFVDNWFTPSLGSPDYFNACDPGGQFVSRGVPNNSTGSQLAKMGGAAYPGIAAYLLAPPLVSIREYIEVQLTKPLDPCKNYCTKIHVSLAEASEYAIANIGMHFSVGPLTSSSLSYFPVNPQVENDFNNIIEERDDWVLISGIFTAQGGEDHITIGNFNSNGATNIKFVGAKKLMYFLFPMGTPLSWAYYYIDEVSVIELPENTTIVYEDINCYGEQTGSAIATPYTQTINHDYTWNTAPITNDSIIQNQFAGTYISTIDNQVGCIFTDTINIVEPDSFDFNFNVVPPCSLVDSGSVTAMISGGTPVYSYAWSPSISDTDSMVNALAGTYQLTLTDLYGCIDSEQVVIPANPGLIISYTANNVCEGDSTIINSLVSGLAADYLWSGMLSSTDSNLAFIHPTAGTFLLTLSARDTFNCLFTYLDSVAVYVVPDTYNLDTTACFENSLLLGQASNNNLVWFENGANIGTSTGITFSEVVSSDKSYLTVAGNGNCFSDTGFVNISSVNCAIYIPNAFSPNNDGENDFFRVRGEGLTNYYIRIYDRWGNRVFEANDINKKWLGTLNNAGVYVYVITGKFFDDNEISSKGNITLIR